MTFFLFMRFLIEDFSFYVSSFGKGFSMLTLILNLLLVINDHSVKTRPHHIALPSCKGLKRQTNISHVVKV